MIEDKINKVENLSSIRLDEEGLRKYSNKIIDENFNVEIIFVDIDEIIKFNNKYRSINAEADILTFTDEKVDSLHQIIICPKVAMRNCGLYKNTLDKEIKLLIFHGWQHISGNHHP